MYLFAKTLSGLSPINDDARDWLSRQKHGAVIRGEFKAPRNGARLRKYFALLDLVYDNLPDHSGFPTRGHLDDAIRVALGFYDKVKLPGGKEWPRPQSVSFAAMKEQDFIAFLDGAVKLVRERLLPKVTDEELRARLEEMVG